MGQDSICVAHNKQQTNKYAPFLDKHAIQNILRDIMAKRTI